MPVTQSQSWCLEQVGEGAYQEGSYLGGAQQPWGRAQGQYQGHMGSFIPITGHYTQEPNDPAYARSVHDSALCLQQAP